MNFKMTRKVASIKLILKYIIISRAVGIFFHHPKMYIAATCKDRTFLILRNFQVRSETFKTRPFCFTLNFKMEQHNFHHMKGYMFLY